ncbi:hypothetical protein Tco_0535547 [Tanacetum coccineum]
MDQQLLGDCCARDAWMLYKTFMNLQALTLSRGLKRSLVGLKIIGSKRLSKCLRFTLDSLCNRPRARERYDDDDTALAATEIEKMEQELWTLT